MKNFENKIIIVTGAAMGLGLAAAKEPAINTDYNWNSSVVMN